MLAPSTASASTLTWPLLQLLPRPRTVPTSRPHRSSTRPRVRQPAVRSGDRKLTEVEAAILLERLVAASRSGGIQTGPTSWPPALVAAAGHATHRRGRSSSSSSGDGSSEGGGAGGAGSVPLPAGAAMADADDLLTTGGGNSSVQMGAGGALAARSRTGSYSRGWPGQALGVWAWAVQRSPRAPAGLEGDGRPFAGRNLRRGSGAGGSGGAARPAGAAAAVAAGDAVPGQLGHAAAAAATGHLACGGGGGGVGGGGGGGGGGRHSRWLLRAAASAAASQALCGASVVSIQMQMQMLGVLGGVQEYWEVQEATAPARRRAPRPARLSRPPGPTPPAPAADPVPGAAAARVYLMLAVVNSLVRQGEEMRAALVAQAAQLAACLDALLASGARGGPELRAKLKAAAAAAAAAAASKQRRGHKNAILPQHKAQVQLQAPPVFSLGAAGPGRMSSGLSARGGGGAAATLAATAGSGAMAGEAAERGRLCSAGALWMATKCETSVGCADMCARAAAVLPQEPFV
ncbi:hypothetical protein HXX76_012948 [Chlamydomonas incerta]|uniref:Uncharacterized protein n=1 Tax=Chlamydomonas incerta TaxID=51695 RepID=A0A835SQX8_CHLIN|nr:hypothetical protein HXX76_012948 [Chlamydomonas incerta]|eukprot:KAG2426634.1 hypothetical protein HXX76_012948 [Chlamydomonas incerta]